MDNDGVEVARAFVTIIPKTDHSTDRAITDAVVGPAEKAADVGGGKVGKGIGGGLTKGVKASSGKLSAAIGSIAKVGAAAAVAGVGLIATKGVDAFQQVEAGANKVILATGATGDAAKELTGVYKEVSRNVYGNFEDVGAAVGELNTRFGLQGDALEAASEQAMKYAKVTGQDATQAIQDVSRMMNNAGISSDQYAETLDKLTVAGQAAGIDVAKLATTVNDNAASFEAMGFSTDEAIAMLASFEKSGVNASTVLTGMRKGIKSFTDAGEPAGEAMKMFVESVQDGSWTMEDAIETFGSKAGVTMYNAAKKGQFDFEEMYKSITDGSAGALDQVYEDTLTASEKMDLAMKSIDLSAAELMAPIMEKVSEVLSNVVVPAVQNLSRELGEGGGLHWIVEGVSTAVEKLSGFASDVGERAFPIVQRAGQMVANVFTTIADHAGPVIDDVLGFVIGFIDDHSDQIMMFVDGVCTVVEGLATVLGTVFDVLGAIWDVVEPIVELVAGTVVDTVLPALKDGLDVVAGALGPVGDALGVVKGAVEDAGEAIAPFVEDAKTAFEDMKGKAEETFQAVGSVIQTDLETAQNVGEAAVHGLQAAMSGDFETARKDAESAFEMIRGNIDAKLDAAEEVVASAAGEIGDKLGFPGLEDTVHDVFDNVKGFIDDPIGSAQEFVKDRADDIAKALGFDGVEDMAKTQFEDIQKFMEDPIGTAKETIEGIVSDIEGFFDNMDIQLPHIDLPHFGISGDFNLDPMNFQVPTITVDWYDRGGIFKGGSAQVIGVAERRDEVVAPLEELPDLLGVGRGGITVNLQYDASKGARDMAWDIAREVRLLEMAGAF